MSCQSMPHHLPWVPPHCPDSTQHLSRPTWSWASPVTWPSSWHCASREEGTRDQAQGSTRTFSPHKLMPWDSELAVIPPLQLSYTCPAGVWWLDLSPWCSQEDDDGVKLLGYGRRTTYLLPVSLYLLCSSIRTQMVTGLDTDEQKQYPCSPIRGMDWDLGAWTREGER